MADKLTKFSSLDDLKGCSNDALVAGIDAVGTKIIVSYINDLREELKLRGIELGQLVIVHDS
jgi:hypothetical protein